MLDRSGLSAIINKIMGHRPIEVTIKNLIPYFIYDQYKKNKLKGELQAVTMFVDIVGFTPMTQNLMKYGKEGAEVLSEVINQAFAPAISAIHCRRGLITSFAGDAFTALFPHSEDIPAIYAAKEIQANFEKFQIQTKFGNFHLSVRIGISYGKVDWGIIPSRLQHIYYFRGKAIDGCTEAEHYCKPNEIVVDRHLKRKINKKALLAKRKAGYLLLKKIIFPEPAIRPLRIDTPDQAIIAQFVPQSVLYLKGGEFRTVTALFISFDKVKNLYQFSQQVMEKVNQFGGYLKEISFGDKGNIMVVLFGAPRAIEKPFAHALEFTLDLKNTVSGSVNLRMGITYGTVYAGMIGSKERLEYTAMGEVVNLSARFMQKAHWHEIIFDGCMYKEIKNEFEASYLGKFRFKGFKDKISIYRLLKKKTVPTRHFAGRLVGRERELITLRKLIEPIDSKKFGGVIYVNGPTGIGKSKLVETLKDDLDKKNYNWFYLPCDEILHQSFNPVSYFLRNYFNQREEESVTTNKRSFEEKFKKLIQKIRVEEIKKELVRNKSILGALLNLHWRGSLYEQLDAKARYENTLYVFKNLIKAECLQKKVIIEIEDGQWIDANTTELLKVLTYNVSNFPFVIISTCRLKDDGTPFRFALTNEPQHSILLESLDKNTAELLIEAQLGNKAAPKLLELIRIKSEGNPFFIEQIILYLKEIKALTAKNGFIELIKEEFEIPGKIITIIISRIDRLEAKLKDLVKTASVLGREFSVRILSAMLKGMSIEKLLRKGEGEAIWTALSEILYIFKHTLIRDAVYEMQLKKTLRELHKFAAETIEKLNKDEIALHYGELAYHYERAEIKLKAKEYLNKAGDYAKDKYKNEEAIDFYDRLLKYIKDQKKKAEVYLKKGAILELIGRWSLAESIYRKASEWAKALRDSTLIANCKNSLGMLLWRKGSYQEAFSLFEDAYMIFANLGDKQQITISLGYLGIVHARQGNYSKAMEYYNKCLNLAEKLGDRATIGRILNNLGIVYDNQGNKEKAMACYKKSLNIAEEMNNKRLTSIIVGNMGIIYKNRNEFLKAMECLRQQLTIDEELGNREGVSRAVGNMGLVYEKQDNYLKAEKCYLRYLNNAEELGDRYGICIATANLANLYKILKDFIKAERYYERAIATARELCLKIELAGCLYHNADLCFALGRIAEATILNDEAANIARETKHEELISETNILAAKLISRSN